MARRSDRSETQVQALDNKLRSLFECTRDAIVLIDVGGRIIDANPVFIKRYTRYHTECIGTNIYEMMSTEPMLKQLLSKRKALGQKVIRTRKSASFEDVQDGAVLKHTLYPVLSDAGEVAEIFIITQDITRQKRIETEFQDSRSQLLFILEKSHLGVWSLELKHGVIKHTLEFDRMLGFDTLQPEWRYENYRSLVLPEDRRKLDQLYKDLRGHLANWNIEYRITRTDGAIRWIEHFGGCERNRKGHPVRLMGLTRDITDVREAERKVIEQDRQWDFISQSCHLGLWKVDLETMNATWNREQARLLGYEPDHEGHPKNFLFDFIVPEERKAIRKLFRETMKSCRNTSFECRIRRLDGDIRWVQVTAAIQCDQNGKPCQMVGVTQDVTESKVIEAEHLKIQEQLNQSQKLELLGQLAGGIAHDFNNVMAAILGNTEIAMRQLNRQQPVFRNLESIKSSVNRSAEMVRQLLGFARKQHWQPQSIWLDRELNKMQFMLRQLVRENIEIRWELNTPGVFVNIDPANLVQIITNLCINSVDAIAEAGVITIATETVDPYACEDLKNVSNETAGAFVRITVTDTGSGIAPEALPHIFEPFYTTKPVGKGTGLGLSMAYGLVKKNNGHITCQTESGKGTSFNIYFPVEAAEGKKPHEPSIPATFNFMLKDVVLLVEDEKSILTIIKKILEQHGIAVITAETAETALRIFNRRKANICLVITDVLLPGKNGIQMSEIMKQQKPDVRFIFMSGYSPDTIGQEYGDFRKEANFISKPFAIKDFLQLVKDVIEQAPS